MYVIGLDIGGANLKSADCDGRAQALAFELWKTPELLAETLQKLLAGYAKPDLVAVTMTGELADCFATKQEGVAQILISVAQAVGQTPTVVWQTGAEFLTMDLAVEFPLLVAAANWHALATWMGRMTPDENSLLIDIGSTTADIIPLENGFPVPEGLTDVERLLSGELVYTGGRRTPLAMIKNRVPLRGQECPLAAEYFATSLDLYLILGEREDNPADQETANGKPATREHAFNRIARSVCCDVSELTEAEAVEVAQNLADEQLRQILHAIDQVVGRMSAPPAQILISGSAVFLAEKAVRSHPKLSPIPVTNVTELFDGAVSESACAYAVARLAAERIRL